MRKKLKTGLILFLLTLSGCGLFDLRDAESPVESRSNFIPPTSPDIVISNLVSAISERNITNYLQCFVDSNFSEKRFSYVADANSASQYPILRFWTLTNERYYFTNVISSTPNSGTSALFLSDMVINNTSDTAIVDSDYLLRFDHTKQNVSKTLKGQFRLIMAADSRNLWSIYKWIDFRKTPSDTTWSTLKANFSN